MPGWFHRPDCVLPVRYAAQEDAGPEQEGSDLGCGCGVQRSVGLRVPDGEEERRDWSVERHSVQPGEGRPLRRSDVLLQRGVQELLLLQERLHHQLLEAHPQGGY